MLEFETLSKASVVSLSWARNFNIVTKYWLVPGTDSSVK